MRVHSRVDLITNSSGEVFVVRRDQVPDNVDELIRSLWQIWKRDKVDSFETEFYAPILSDENFDPAPLFALSSMTGESSIHYGKNWSQSDAVKDFLGQCDDNLHGFLGSINAETFDRILESHPDLELFVDWYLDIQEQWREENRSSEFWIFDAVNHIADTAIEAGLFDEFEEVANLFTELEAGMFGQWRYVSSSFKMYHAYQAAELHGEIDDHVYPQSFVYFVCDTLGWYCYHNG